MGNFDFAKQRWPQIWDAAHRAEGHLRSDPRASATYARRAAELFTGWIYTAEDLPRPYDDSFAGLARAREFKASVGRSITVKLDIIRRIGNDAVHKEAAIALDRALSALDQLHQVLRWLAHCYGDVDTEPAPFDRQLIPPSPAGVVQKARVELERLQEQNEAKDRALVEARERDAAAQVELEALRAEIAALKAASAETNRTEERPDPTAATEAQTRELYIDVLLGEAGWKLDQPRDREFPVTGVPSPTGAGKVDYVLWGDDGLPLAVVEAKRTGRSAREGREQARIYADALEKQFGQRPVIFASNGYEHWIWDDERYPARRISGFYTREQLQLVIQRRSTLRALTSVSVDEKIVGRPYQLRAIRSIAESFDGGRRRALLVMATGTGKTRTAIALVDVLQHANWAKRVLFLADRTALVRQAAAAFKTHLPDSATVNLIDDKDTEGRVFVSTYQTILGLIDRGEDELRRFGPGYFDLIVVDEAHRSIYARYGEIFDYFDALLVGLTATPRSEVDHNTYRLFELEDGVPTDAFELEEAIHGGYLVPPVARSLELGFMRRGIRYDQLTDAERAQWDSLEWAGGDIPDEIDAAAMNRWLFNEDTVDKVLEVVMTTGRTVAGGDRLGKTIIFAKSQAHADFISDRIDFHYPQYRSGFAKVITHKSGPWAQKLIDDFSTPDSAPHLAISVDMLDTGIDIPEVLNLVFFKPVHSQTKYWQMIGRGTRLRPDLYGPGMPKTDFVVFDVCGNIEYFGQQLPVASVTRTRSIGERLFAERVALLASLNGSGAEIPLRDALASILESRVAGMSRTNFLVRAHLRAVDRFPDASAWRRPFSSDDVSAAAELALLPSTADIDTDEHAKRFDLLVLAAQLARADGAAVPAPIVTRIAEIVSALGQQRGVPKVKAQAALLDAVVDAGWWDAADLADLEDLRLRLRSLVSLIPPAGQKPIFTDFEDVLADGGESQLPGFQAAVDRQLFNRQVYEFLSTHNDVTALRKLRTGRQLTPLDLEQLERILVEEGGLDAGELHTRADGAHGLGRFIRSIVGLERGAAEALLSDFVSGPALTRNQHAFVDLVLAELTVEGFLDAARLYEDPYSGVAPEGPEALFTEAQITDLVERLDRVGRAAEASTA